MHVRICLLAVWLWGVWHAGAQETLPALAAGDYVYTNVTVTKVTATDVYFTHARGVGNVKLNDLAPQWQQHFKYDATKAGMVATQQWAATAEYRKNLAARPATRPPVVAEPEPSATRRGAEEMLDPRPRSRRFLNQPAPRLAVEKWLTPAPDMAGKFILIDFWATWCGPCRAAIPKLNQIQARYQDRLVVVGLSDEPEIIVRKMTSPKMDYFVAVDTQQRLSGAVGVQAIPHVMIIDPKGIVRYEGNPSYLTTHGLENLFARYAN